jgi:4-amino-4-deoxy-L-arabinose transferase-like glycosyltransferase
MSGELPGEPPPPGRLSRRSATLLLSGIVALALGLRLLWLRTDSTFQRTDEVMFLLNAFRLSGAGAEDLFWTVAFPWGYPVLVFILGALSAFQWLGVPIRESTIVAPFAVLGGLAPWLLYRLARRAFSRGVALTAALALAVLPSHIAQSRTVAAWILAANLMMLTILLAWRYVERGRPADALAFSAALAVYLPSDNLAPGTLLLLAVMALVWPSGTLRERLHWARAVFIRPAVLVLPALSLGLLVAVQVVFVVTGRPTYGFLGHYLAGKVDRGVHLEPVLSGLLDNLGPPLTGLVLFGCVLAVARPSRCRHGWVFPVWLLCFALPTILLIDPAGTLVSGYLTPVLLALLVLGAAGFGAATAASARAIGPRPARTASAAVLIVFFGVAAALVPSRIYARSFLVPPQPIGLWGGEIYDNDGAKTAGYWIRRNTPPGALVLSDLRLFVGKYYFHRPTASLERMEVLRRRVGVVAVKATSRGRVQAAGWLEGFGLAATVMHGDRPVFLIYARASVTPDSGMHHTGPPVTLAAEEFDPRFDREFGRIGTLRYPRIWGDDG